MNGLRLSTHATANMSVWRCHSVCVTLQGLSKVIYPQYLDQFCAACIDDIIVYSEHEEEHICRTCLERSSKAERTESPARYRPVPMKKNI
jgi:hypothetical protein